MPAKGNRAPGSGKYQVHEKFRGPQIGAEKLRRAARETPLVRKAAAEFYGEEKKKAENIMRFVISRTLMAPRTEEKKGAIGTAHRMLAGKAGHEPSVCFDRCNLAIGLLNAAGIKSWLVREVALGDNAKWEIHDYVEAAIGGKVHTLVFAHNPLEGRLYYWMEPKPAHEAIETRFGVGTFFRGADSANIGGVKDMKGVVRLRNRLEDSAKFRAEREKNKRRVDLLVKEGIMPKEFAQRLKKEGQA